MKTKISIFIICCMALISSCKKDGDMIKVKGIDGSDLLASETDIVLTKETSSSSVLALTWNKSSLSISDTSMKLPSTIPAYIIEVSTSEDFSSFTEITPQSNTYAFTGVALNTMAKNLGLTAGVSAPLYFRIRTALGNNTEPYYSAVKTVNITCYSIDMSIGFILNSDKEDTGFKLYSPNSDGEYHGFTGVTAWYNWYLLEGDGTTWGNLGVDGNEFILSKESTQWNFWYPGIGGCYYTTLSTNAKEWTATNIPSLKLSGGVTASMTFDRLAVKWYVSFTTSSDNVTAKVTCDEAKLYNKTTKTDDAAAVTKTLGFIPNADSTLSIDWNSSSAGNITIPKAGDYTLTLNLADPTKWTYSLKSGITVVTKPLSKKLFLMGIDDNIVPGNWNFNRYLQLVSEDDSTYAGVVQVDSQWGFQMALDSGEWTNIYKMGATAGTLSYKTGDNIAAPTAGLYLMKADLKNLTYSFTLVTGLSYAGLNDDWGLTAMTQTSETGVYSSSVTLNTVSSDGFQLVVNENWVYYFGGANGVLQYRGPNIKDDASIATAGSTYDLIADVRNNFCVFLGDEIYIGGLNDAWNFTAVVLNRTATGVYTGMATITAPSTDGIRIYVQKDNWGWYFGGSFSSMKYLGANITDDQSLTNGNYTITVDFINNTCSFTAN